MKKIVTILTALLLCVSSTFAAYTIKIEAYAVNKDGSIPVAGTVTLKVTKSRGKNGADSSGTTKTSNAKGELISVKADGYDGLFFGLGAYNPEVALSVQPTIEGYYLEAIYLEKADGTLEGVGTSGFDVLGNANFTRKYKVVFDKKKSSLPEEITYSNNTSLEFYTGTELDQSTSVFYKEKTKIDLSSTFASDGQPLFDVLYLFGMTTSKDGKVINEPRLYSNVVCNATTPCYVYKKDGSRYVFDSEFDAVQARVEHGTSMNSKKLYFTGYCPFANIGSQTNDEGWMYFSGKGANVDIYLENCEILGKYRTGDGSGNVSKFPTNYIDFTLTTLTQEYRGVSSIFVFEGTGQNAYAPTIHIKGSNHLKGQFGYITELLALGKSLDNLGMPRMQNILTYSAPVTLKTLNGPVALTMDDIWPEGSVNRITNGFLKLDAYPLNEQGYTAEKCPAIDLGTDLGSLTINGGQYHLRNNASVDGNYTSNLAVCYRFYTEANVANLYGFGNDMTEAPVVINSGTFTLSPNMYGQIGGQYYLSDNYLDLRLPAGKGNSQINGGTFNGMDNVLLCSTVASSGGSPINAQGEWLCLQEVPVIDDLSDNIPVQEINLPEHIVDHGVTDVKYNLLASGAMEALEAAEAYGGQSLNAYQKDGKTIVRLLLPGDACNTSCEDCENVVEALYRNWAFAIPKVAMEGTLGGETGGEIEIDTAATDGASLEVKVNQLMYVDMLGLENITISSEAAGTTIKFVNKEQPRGQIKNAGQYKIYEHLNILKVVDADQWYCFTAPFDISKVSVLEVWEEAVKEAAKVAENNNKDAKQAAIEKQFAANSNFWMQIRTLLQPNGNRYGSSLTFDQMANSSSLGSHLYPLTHYDGTNLLSANYYLYELESEEFMTDGTKEKLDIKWIPVKRSAGEPLMYAHKTYAIQFPYCPMCNDLNTRDYYDYWSKKFVQFYGKGPSTLEGTNYHSTILDKTPNNDNTAILVGNSTFRDMTLDAGDGYVHNPSTDYFEPKDISYTVKPMEGYLMYKQGSSNMPKRISRSGEIVYPDNTSTDSEEVPTIAERTSVMLFDAMDGFDILSLCEQVVLVYNLQGNVVFHQQMGAGEQVHVCVASGIYVVKGAHEAIKIRVD